MSILNILNKLRRGKATPGSQTNHCCQELKHLVLYDFFFLMVKNSIFQPQIKRTALFCSDIFHFIDSDRKSLSRTQHQLHICSHSSAHYLQTRTQKSLFIEALTIKGLKMLFWSLIIMSREVILDPDKELVLVEIKTVISVI